MLATKSTFASNGESSIPVTKALSSFETNSVSSSISKLNNTFSIHVTTPTTADFTPIGAGGRTPIDANSKLSLISRSKAADTITASTSTSSDFDVFNVFSEAHVDPNTQNHPSPAILKTLKETQAGPAPLIGQTSRDSLEFISVGSAISEASVSRAKASKFPSTGPAAPSVTTTEPVVEALPTGTLEFHRRVVQGVSSSDGINHCPSLHVPPGPATQTTCYGYQTYHVGALGHHTTARFPHPSQTPCLADYAHVGVRGHEHCGH